MPCLSLMALIEVFSNFHCLTRNYTLAVGYSYFQICHAELSLSLYSLFHLMKSFTLFRISVLDDSLPGHPVCLNTQHVIFVVSHVRLSWSHVSICISYSGWEIVVVSYDLYLRDCLLNFPLCRCLLPFNRCHLLTSFSFRSSISAQSVLLAFWRYIYTFVHTYM